MITISQAGTPQEREAAFQLRYEVYIREFDYPFRASAARLTDEWDSMATIFLLEENGHLIGTARMNSAVSLPGTEEVERRYRLSSFPECPPKKIFIGSRAILSRAARGGRQFRFLFREIFRWGVTNDVRLAIIDSSPALVPLYLRLGWVRYPNNFQDPALGERVPLVLRVTDHDYLQRIDSPFCAVLDNLELR